MSYQFPTLLTAHKPLKHWRRYFVTGGVLAISNLSAVQAEPATGPLPSFSGVHIGSATVGVNGHTLTVDQSSQTAVLDWNSFNIGAGNNVAFNQPGSTSIALNNIHDANASQISGNLTANGQIYLVNTNGIVFGPNAAVNVNSLVATSLPISDAVFQSGIANQNVGATLGAAFTGTGAVYLPGSKEKISILVEKGAAITAADEGRVILAAPEVINNGTITAPDGQVILAAATDNVYLQASNSSDLRGLLVEVQTGGDVKNLGSILTARGNTTMMGFAVTQDGVISASTSVALNGSVRLLAREGAQLINAGNANTSAGTDFVLEPVTTARSSAGNDGLGTQASVTLGPGSSTQVTLDDSGGTAVAGQAQPQSIVDLEAGLIDMQSGSQIVAHSGIVNLSADLAPILSNSAFSATTTPTDQSSAENSRILLETGSNIDVSGVQHVAMPMSGNIVNLNLFSYELRNDPIQKNGLLYGQNVYVDTRLGTPLNIE